MERLDRAELRSLIDRLMAGDYSDDDELDRDARLLRASVPHPHPLDLIFYPDRYFDEAPTAEDVLNRALNYRAIAL